MLKRKYISTYPGIPSDIMLKATASSNNVLTVVYVDGSDICTADLPVSILRKIY